MAGVVYHLRDFGSELVDAWMSRFADVPSVHPAVGDIFAEPVDAVVSPANCFGFMDGGIDRAYSLRFGWHVQERLREVIARDWDGELPIGLALIVETGANDIRYVIAAPTLRAPVSVAGTLNAYLSFRAVLRAVQRWNAVNVDAIGRVASPGMGTGTGEMSATICAKQMRAAWDEVEEGLTFNPKGVNDALLQHYRLLRED